MKRPMNLALAIVGAIFFLEVELAYTVPLTDGTNNVENSLEKAVIHTDSRGTGLVASANASAVSSRAPSRQRRSKRRRQQGESLSRFDPCAEYIDSICPHGHTVCVAFSASLPPSLPSRPTLTFWANVAQMTAMSSWEVARV